MFSSAFKGRGLTVVYVDGKKRLVKRGGTRSWRNNNPGNIKSGTHSRIHGAIGSISGFAVFPSYEEGKAALLRLFRRSDFREKTIFEMVSSYAPKKDRNDPVRYRKILRQKTALNLDRKLKDLSDAELAKLASAVQEIEGFQPGSEESFYAKSITDIRTNKRNAIIAYQIENWGWKSKAEAIQLIEEGRVDAVLVEENGSVYVRTRPDGELINNLEAKKPRKRPKR
ncbi:MAG: DUF3892 domain-containing protein [Deltaproteobacteria bacterium]|nr:DUF3892 domain-containing protein [Deltaproteobacteria bacterium]